jgi:hypothetical protein
MLTVMLSSQTDIALKVRTKQTGISQLWCENKQIKNAKNTNKKLPLPPKNLLHKIAN